MTAGDDIMVGPAPIPRDARLVLVFGGTFDPPHRAHVELPLAAREAVGADRLLYMPASRSPLKDGIPETRAADRLAMLRAALEGRDHASISTLELDRPGPSYTVDTLRILRTRLPPTTAMRLLIGADQAADFHRWREPMEVIRLAEPLVMLRAPLESRHALIESMRPHWPADELSRWERWIVGVPMIDASATEIRRLLREQGPDAPALRDVLSEGVRTVIRERRLYRSMP